MSSIPRETTINGPAERVFDIITQVRFWPQWHVLTRAVSGTIERPFLPGDEFTEFIRTAGGTKELTWEVVDYERPKRVTIRLVGLPPSISYTFEEVAEGTLFRRVVAGVDPDATRTVSSDTEARSVASLKALVEGILAREKKGPQYP
jgi:uncharacterized protein YndB with AHSA1/START domain